MEAGIMRIIYEPRGRALEYAPLAVSLYRGCPHGCVYCFAPASTRTDREKFLQANPRKNAINLLKADVAELAAANDQREILMSFTTDPYQPLEQYHHLTSTAIGILINHGLHFTVLTKAGINSMVDFERLASRPDLCRYGTTLVFNREEDRQKWEPNAAPTTERVKALKAAHEKGIPTWVSLEPMIDPDQTLFLITVTHPFVDEYRLGALNHAEKTLTDDQMVDFVSKAYTLLRFYKKKFIFKKDLQPYLQTAGGCLDDQHV
jgi:DNA repair photolyase